MKADNYCVGAYYDDTFGNPENPFGLISCEHFEHTIRDDISLALLAGIMAVVGAVVGRRASLLPKVQGGTACFVGMLGGNLWWYWAPIHYGWQPNVLSLSFLAALVLAFGVGAVGAAFGRAIGA